MRTSSSRSKPCACLAKLTVALNEFSSQVLDGDGEEHTHESEADRELMRSVAAQSIVLLKNKDGLLPLKPKVSIFAIPLL